MSEQNQPTVEELLAEAMKITQERETSRNTQIAVVLLSSAFVGTSAKKLKDFTGYPSTLIAQVKERCERNGIFKGNRVRANWFEEDGGIALLCDVMVVEGLLAKA